MSRRLPSLSGLKSFEAAARHLSFTRAAEELHVTQAAISHQVKALEAQLGVVLFRRLNRALMLTDAGQRLFPPVREALDQLAQATARVRSEAEMGPLTVATIPSFAAKWLVPRMSDFLDRHPEIELRIAAGERLSEFLRDGIDVAVRFGAGHWAGLAAELLAEEAVTPVMSPALLRYIKGPSDLARMTLLHEEMGPLERFPVWRDWFDATGLIGVDATRGPVFSHTHIMLQAAMSGRGVALGQILLVADDVRAGRLVAPFELRLPANYAYYLVHLPDAAQQSKIKAFRDWIFEQVACGPKV